MNQKLLVCLAFHFVPDRIKYLIKVLETFTQEYQCPVHIIIDTNVAELPPECTLNGHPDIEVVSHLDLGHPFFLTRCHRVHFARLIDQYDVMGYFEDDHYVPYGNYIEALDKYEFMWPGGYIPSFIRIEEADGKMFVSDVPKHYKVDDIKHVKFGERNFISFPFPHSYCGFWFMPTKMLRDNMIPSFTKMTDAREWSANYSSWELNKTPLVEVFYENGGWFIDPNCYAWHLPANYIGSSMGNASIEVKDIFI